MITGIEVFNKRALIYEQKYMDVRAYAEGFDFLLSHIRGTNVLDVACGPGNVAAYMLAKTPALHWFGIDLSPNMVQLASKNAPEGKFQVMDAKHIHTLQTPFHAVISAFCFPYLTPEEVRLFCKSASALLQPGGLIYVSTMAGQSTHTAMQVNSFGDELHTYYHAPADILAVLQQSGFKLRQSWPPEETWKDIENGKDVVLIATKAEV